MSVLQINDQTIINDQTAYIDIAGTAGVRIVRGTTAQRSASPVEGMLRYNFSTESYEGYDGIEWIEIKTAIV